MKPEATETGAFLTFMAASAEISFKWQLSVIDVPFTKTIAIVCFRAGLIL